MKKIQKTPKIKITNIDILSSKISSNFDGFKILHISDLHNKEFGIGQKALAEKIAALQPNIIAVTGDLIDRRKTGFKCAVDFAKESVKIAPVYFSSGNHEIKCSQYEQLKAELIGAGVKILDNDMSVISKNDDIISIIGVSDFEAFETSQKFQNTIIDLTTRAKGYKILMSHKPHKINIYKESGADLILSGHAHGGQIRIPIIGGLYAPGQGFFPRYTNGLHNIGNGVFMVISRGLGDSVFPWRINNKPEILLITLKKSD